MGELLPWPLDFSDFVLPEVPKDVQRHHVRWLTASQLLCVRMANYLRCLPILLLVPRAPLLNIQGPVDSVE